ncbi:MAG: hypothetical protein ACERKK_04035 [Poseidonibacter sp.]|uniref:hypothetical protein n=1 Tax=Poseidonibacter sp. TaxID=2321188 RepID=UPI00359E6C2A
MKLETFQTIAVGSILIWAIICIKLAYINKDLNGAIEDNRYKTGWRDNIEPEYVRKISFKKYFNLVFILYSVFFVIYFLVYKGN